MNVFLSKQKEVASILINCDSDLKIDSTASLNCSSLGLSHRTGSDFLSVSLRSTLLSKYVKTTIKKLMNVSKRDDEWNHDVVLRVILKNGFETLSA